MDRIARSSECSESGIVFLDTFSVHSSGSIECIDNLLALACASSAGATQKRTRFLNWCLDAILAVAGGTVTE